MSAQLRDPKSQECGSVGVPSTAPALKLVSKTEAVAQGSPAQEIHYNFQTINPLLVFAMALCAALLSVGAIATMVEAFNHLEDEGVLPASTAMFAALTENN